jgi:hypothetical protein
MQLSNQSNVVTNAALCSAMAALHHLDAAGATVLDVEVAGRNPRIRIDAGQAFLHGSMKSRIREHGVQRVVMTARVHDCQVEWTERYAEPRAAQRGR